MRSRRTTNTLLVLAFLFILTIIILCLLPTEKKPGQKPQYEEFEQDEPEKTTKTFSKATTSSTFSTAETTESTLATIGTTTEKHLPPSTEREETISSTVTEVSVPPTTVKEHHTSTSEPPSTGTTTSTFDSTTTTVKLTTVPKYTAYTTTEQSTYNKTYTTSFESTTQATHDPYVNATTNYTSTPSIATITTTHNETYTTSFESTTQATHDPYMNATTNYTSTPSITTTATTPIPAITAQTTPTTTSTTTTTTTIPPTTPYDHKFTPYSEPQEVCTSDGCKEVSAKMLDSLNHQIDPCENFHEYSCGGLHNDQFLSPESDEENLDHILKEELVSHDTEALRFYDSCLNYVDGTGESESEEGMKHEGLFPPHWKIYFPKSEVTWWPSQNLTRTLTSLISRDLPVLFDVTAEVREVKGSIKILPKLRLSLLDDFESNYDHKYCIDRFRRRMRERRHGEGTIHHSGEEYRKGLKPEGDNKDKPLNEILKVQNLRGNSDVEEEILKVDIEHEYKLYLDCMNSDGVDLRVKRVEPLLLESDLFAPHLKTRDKKSLVRKIRDFLIDLNEILLSPSNIAGGETPSEITTLGDIDGNTVLGGFINWVYVLSELLGYPVPLDQQIIIENVSKFSSIFSLFKNNWIDKNIENVVVMLAAEKLFRIKGEDRDFKKDFCFALTKKYLPLHMQLLFTKAFSPRELNVLISEVTNLGSSVPVEIAKHLAGYLHLETYVEFFDNQTLMWNLQHFNTQIKLTGDFLSNLRLLQTHYRKNMYNVTGTELEDPESCGLLPRDLSVRCNLYADIIIVPLKYLVPPNFIFRKDMPNYLRLAGIANYITEMIVFRLDTKELNVKGYKGNDCLIENIPSVFEEKIKNLKVEYTMNANEEVKSGTLLQFQAFNIAWRVIKHLPQLNNDSLEENETQENPLIWQGADALSPLKAFLIRKAQESCREDNHFDLLRISLFKEPPNYFWINTLMKIDTLFGSALHCPLNSSMAQSRECLPEATTTDWQDPYEVTTTTTTEPLE